MSFKRTKDLAPVDNETSVSESVIWPPLCGNLLLIFGGLLLLPWEKPWVLSSLGASMVVLGNFLRRGWNVQRTS